jgi:hypothetical protein
VKRKKGLGKLAFWKKGNLFVWFLEVAHGKKEGKEIKVGTNQMITLDPNPRSTKAN